MSQFDPLIIFTLIFSLLIILYLYYLYQIDNAIPYFMETKKFRIKKFEKLKNFKQVVNSSCYYLIDFKVFKI
jgi:hypothetical protein